MSDCAIRDHRAWWKSTIGIDAYALELFVWRVDCTQLHHNSSVRRCPCNRISTHIDGSAIGVNLARRSCADAAPIVALTNRSGRSSGENEVRLRIGTWGGELQPAKRSNYRAKFRANRHLGTGWDGVVSALHIFPDRARHNRLDDGPHPHRDPDTGSVAIIAFD